MIAQYFGFLIPRRQKEPPTPPAPLPTIGCLIGPFGRNLCWEARGVSRDLYQQSLAPQITAYLNDNFGCIPGDDHITISMYMTGQSVEKASPTLLVISKSPSTRKEVRDTIKKSGIMSRYPDFQVKYVSKDPGSNKIESLATSEAPLDGLGLPKVDTEVLFDENQPPRILGMPIYIRHANALRAATANVIRIGNKIYLQTANHAFHEENLGIETSVQSKNEELEIDSDTDSDTDMIDDAIVAITSAASQSPDSWSEEPSSDDSESSRRSSMFSKVATPTVEFPPFGTKAALNDAIARLAGLNSKRKTFVPTELKPPGEKSLHPLGRRLYGSADLDFAVIDITNTIVAKSLVHSCRVLGGQPIAYNAIASEPRTGAKVYTRTALGEHLTGTLSGTPSFMRLTHGSSFQEVYTVKLDGPLFMGICGSAIIDIHSGETYGHVVAGCRTTGSAYVVTAIQTMAFLSELTPEASLLDSHGRAKAESFDTMVNVNSRGRWPVSCAIDCLSLALAFLWEALRTYALNFSEMLASYTATISINFLAGLFSAFLKTVAWSSSLGPHRPRIKARTSVFWTSTAYIGLIASQALLYISNNIGFYSGNYRACGHDIGVNYWIGDRANVHCACTFGAPPGIPNCVTSIAWSLKYGLDAYALLSLWSMLYSLVGPARPRSRLSSEMIARVAIRFAAIEVAKIWPILQLTGSTLLSFAKSGGVLGILILGAWSAFSLLVLREFPLGRRLRDLLIFTLTAIFVSPLLSLATEVDQEQLQAYLPAGVDHILVEYRSLLSYVFRCVGTLTTVWACRMLLNPGVLDDSDSGSDKSGETLELHDQLWERVPAWIDDGLRPVMLVVDSASVSTINSS